MPGLPLDAHIGEVTLAVADVDRSLAFYVDLVGFTLLAREAGRAVVGASEGSRPLIRLDEQPAAIPKPRRTSGLFHVAIRVPSRAALGRALRRLAERRWPLTGASDHLVSEALYLDDPDGLGLEIYCDRPRADWQVENGEVMMATEPLDLQAVGSEPGAERPWQGLDADTVIGHVHLQVSDLDRAERLYCGELGFTPTLRRYPGALFVAAGGYHHHVGLNVWAGRGAPAPPPRAVGLRSFTIEASGLSARQVEDAATGVSIRLVPAA